jgi:hypothetical protein
VAYVRKGKRNNFGLQGLVELQFDDIGQRGHAFHLAVAPGAVPSSSIRLPATARRSSPPRRPGGVAGQSSSIRSIATSLSGDGSNTPVRAAGRTGNDIPYCGRAARTIDVTRLR